MTGDRCPLCSAPGHVCGPAGSGGRPVDQLVNEGGTMPGSNEARSPRWVYVQQRPNRPGTWHRFMLGETHPDYPGSVDGNEPKPDGPPAAGDVDQADALGPVTTPRTAANKAVTTRAGSRAAKTTPPADTPPPVTE